MLVLTRELGQRIQIQTDPPIWITVVDVDRGKVKLGIDAARDIPIYREELLPRKEIK